MPARCRTVLSRRSDCIHPPNPQSPWILSGSIRDNITLGLPFQADRYDAVLDVCCLRADLALFAAGDGELIGERGVNLSGGQRARVALARACYMDADLYLLDDPLSAVDARVGRLLFQSCICGFLAGKTRLLVTHQLQFIRASDTIAVLSRGRLLLQGTPVQLAAAVAASLQPSASGEGGAGSLTEVGAALTEVLTSGVVAEDDEEGEEGEGGATEGGDANGLAIASAGSEGASARGPASRRGSAVDAATVLRALSSARSTASRGEGSARRRRLESGGSGAGSRAGAADGDGVVGLRDDEPAPASPGMDGPGVNGGALATAAAASPAATTAAAPTAVGSGGGAVENTTAAAVSWTTFGRYLVYSGGVVGSLVQLLLLCGTAVLLVYTFVWLAAWAQASPSAQREGRFASAYGGLVAASVVACIIRSVAFFQATTTASQKLHDAAFMQVLRAPVSFFDATPSGAVLNRFAKDLVLADEWLPPTLFDLLATSIQILAIMAMVFAINPFILTLLLPMMVAVLLLRRFYMFTGRTTKRLESASRSPVFSVFNEAIAGLPTIRAFGLQQLVAARFFDAADGNTRAYFVFLITSRWVTGGRGGGGGGRATAGPSFNPTLPPLPLYHRGVAGGWACAWTSSASAC
jgi:ABC-type multidrug transport system fused ATPase/permease subunit